MTEQLFHIGMKALIKNTQGQVLVLKENPATHFKSIGAYWDLPGGRMQAGEDFQTALRREVEEEIGVKDIGKSTLLTSVISNHQIPLKNGLTVSLLLMIFEVSLADSTTVILSDEHLGFEWVNPVEAAKRLADKYPPEFTHLIA